MSKYYESTIHIEPYMFQEGRGIREYPSELIKKDWNLSALNKEITQAVFSQIKYLFGDVKPEFDVDTYGNIIIKNVDDLDSEKSNAVKDILATYQFGIYSRHQFKDWKVKKDSTEKDYKNWFSEAKETYFHTIPFRQILSASNYNRDGYWTGERNDIFDMHEKHSFEMLFPNLGIANYNINDLWGTLENDLIPYVLLSLIGSNVHAEEFNKLPYLVCTTKSNKKIAISLFSKEIFKVTTNGLKLLSNSYEYVFKRLYLPIEIILNSVLKANKEKMLPDYEQPHLVEPHLVTMIEQAMSEPGYKKSRILTLQGRNE